MRKQWAIRTHRLKGEMETKGSDYILMLPKGRKKDLYADEVIISVSQHELNVRKITKGDLILLGIDEYNVSNQPHFVNDILTSKDFPKGTITDGQCIIHVKSIPNTIVQSGFAIDNASWKDALTAILVYGFDTKEYKWVGNPADKVMADRVLHFFQRNLNGVLFKDFTDKYGAIWFKDKIEIE